MPTLMDLIKNNVDLANYTRDAVGSWATEKFVDSREDPGIEAGAMQGDPGLSPGLAMIPTAKNLPQFRELMNKWMKLAPKDWPEHVQQGWSYMRARYPGLMSKTQLKKISKEDLDKWGANAVTDWKGAVQFSPEKLGEVGERLPLQSLVYAAEEKTKNPIIKKLAEAFESKGSDTLRNAIQTLAHELRHSLDMKRKGLNPDTYGETYKSVGPALDDEIEWLSKWRFNPWERRAIKSGKTATKGFDKFLDMTGY